MQQPIFVAVVHLTEKNRVRVSSLVGFPLYAPITRKKMSPTSAGNVIKFSLPLEGKVAVRRTDG